MLQICRSNQVESLLERLAERIGAKPLSSVFAQEVIVAPNPAMARWIGLQLGRRHGVAANYCYPLPASLVWELSQRLLTDVPEQDPLQLDVMAWKIFSLLPSMLLEPAFESLRQYLAGEENGLKRWQLASQIADVLDRYQLYRPELIRSWSAGQEQHWQALLWRGLTQDLDQHRVAVIDRLLNRLGHPGESPPLPERISLFAVSSLPPLLVEVVHALGAHAELDLYLHSPTDAFWADLISQKELARKRLDRPEEADLWEVGNNLLASWGRQGQALQDLLLSQELPMTEEDIFVEPPADTLLYRLQRDIFTLKPTAADGERVAIEVDRSLQVHLCHSALRECQVLHDQLLGMLDAYLDLRPEDILVMVPEISLYAPYVEAVFGKTVEGGRPFIPWNLSDIALRDEHPLVLVFLQLLDLPNSRFSHTEILSYLDVPELARRFALDGEALALVRQWLAAANLRWGVDGGHKQRFDLPPAEENTWAQAEQRLFGGYALEEGAAFAGIAPIASVEGKKSEALGRFWRLFSLLTEYAERLTAPRSVSEWQAFLTRMLSDFFGETDDAEGRVQKIRDAVAELAEQAGQLEEPLPPVMVHQWLAKRLGTRARRGGYFSGGVTFCGMRPMRSLPFPVICLLGMHDQAFPRREQPAEFDLMAERWRPGDPLKGDEDRYLFLETLLCARRSLYISYVGRDIRKNSERQPSVLVRELLDYVDQQYRAAGADEEDRLSERLMTVHPLQPFSPRNFADGRASFDDYWCAVAQAVAAPRQPATQDNHWNGVRLPNAPETMREVSLTQLERFLRHPIRFFVNARLKAYLREERVEPDDEVFTLDPLQGYGLKQRMVEGYLEGDPPTRQRLSAEGLLPHGAFSELAYEAEWDKLGPLLESIENYRGKRPQQRLIDLEMHGDAEGPRRLTGQLKGLYPGLGLLRHRPGTLRGQDLLALWLEHLVWCASGEPGEKCSLLHGRDGGVAFRKTLMPQQAREHLALYLDWYWEGVHRPLPVFPKASYACAQALRDEKPDPVAAAWRDWDGNGFLNIPGDKDDPYVQLVSRGLRGNPLADPEFVNLAEAFYAWALKWGETP